MILIPTINNFQFVVQGVEIEGDPLPNGLDVQYPWESNPSRYHSKTIQINSFYIDKYCVTNKEYKSFLTATGYKPKENHNFLKVIIVCNTTTEEKYFSPSQVLSFRIG